METKALLSLFKWLLTRGLSNLKVKDTCINGDELLELKVSGAWVNLPYNSSMSWGTPDEMTLILHYCLMLSCGYLLKKEGPGWVCFRLSVGEEGNTKYDMPSVEQCSCLHAVYNQGGYCRHLKMLRGYLILQDRTEREYKRLY